MNAATEFDVGPLTWVKSEIDLALERALQAVDLYESGASSGAADATQLKFCRTHLHQVQGALTIVGLDGVTQLVEALEGLLESIETQTQPGDTARISLVRKALSAVGQYLAGLVNGQANQPLRLFPLYQEIQAARGAPPASPADLFYPDLSIRQPRQDASFRQLSAADYQHVLKQARGRFQKGLLTWLRTPQESSAVAEMQAAVHLIEETQDHGAGRSFWWVVGGVLQALGNGAAMDMGAVKHLCARIDLQVRRLLEGSKNITERLMRDALYLVASSTSSDATVHQIKQVYRLDALIPSSTEDLAEASSPVSARLREVGASLEVAWNKFCAGSAASLSAFREDAGHLVQWVGQTGHTDYRRLAGAIAAVADWLLESPARQSEALAMEVATAILLAQDAQKNYPNLGGDFAHQVDVTVARMHACMAGRPMAGSSETPLLDEMSRRAQEQLLIAQVAKEIQSNLAQIEQVLDGFFRDAGKRDELATLDGPFRQIVGALSMLGQTGALADLQASQEAVRRLMAPDYVSVDGEFEQLANRLSLLGFFIDAMPRGDVDFESFVRKMQARPQDEAPEDGSSADAGMSVEQEVELGRRKAHTLLEALRDQPADTGLREELRQNLQSLTSDADLVADEHLGEQTRSMLDVLASGADVAPQIEQTLSAIKPEGGEASPETLQLSQASTEEIDAELLAIFIEEAKEVLAAVGDGLGRMKVGRYDNGLMTDIRRAFHTLKGSGRMVGLKDLGEVAWSVEQLLNLWLRLELEVDSALTDILEEAHVVFSEWVIHLETHVAPQPDPQRLIEHCDALRAAAENGRNKPVSIEPETAPSTETVNEGSASPTDDFIQIDFVPVSPDETTDVLGLTLGENEPPTLLVDALPVAQVIPIFPGVGTEQQNNIFETAPDIAPLAETSHQRISISPALFAIFSEEANTYLQTLRRLLPVIESDDAPPTPHDMYRAAHTLAGISATVGLLPVNRLGYALEHALQRRDHTEHPGSLQALGVIRQTIAELESMFAALHEQRGVDVPDGLIEQLEALYPPSVTEITPSFVDAISEADSHLVARLSSDEVQPEEVFTQTQVSPGFDHPLGAVEIPPPPSNEAPPEALFAQTQVSPQPDQMESVEIPPPFSPITPAMAHVHDEIDMQLLPIFLEEAVDLSQAIATQLRAWRAAPDNTETVRVLARQLHTLKGSARMTGAMTLGEITHALEERVDQADQRGFASMDVIDGVESAFESIRQIIDRLQRGEMLGTTDMTGGVPQPGATTPPWSEETAEQFPVERRSDQARLTPVDADSEAMPSQAMLRVRASVVDRLVNEAGELSIARSRIEGEIRGLKESLFDLTENVIRLRRQLREIEIQAELQMQSRSATLSEEKHTGFDPLEFDRFTRFQELTRMMAESVNDVATVQQHLLKSLDDTNAAIVAQARMNRQVQQELMAMRMMPFNSLADRLYRVVRQTSSELDKRSNLEIKGGQIELDRSVLDKIAAPLEHLLRNAVAHGIEARFERAERGKQEIGEITLSLRQEGNEVIVQLSDDGRGLDYERIRVQAEVTGLLEAGASSTPVSHERLAEFIFAPGFTTAESLSQIAGRGVGMDVVKSEVASLGGRVEVSSVPGQGTEFRLILPLTLAVTKALLVRAGNRTFAVPSSMIEQVLDLKEAPLSRIREAGEAEWQSQRYAYSYLPHLLGELDIFPEQRRQYWVLLLRGGTRRVAVQVDELLGNQEIVVKNIGPQLARVIGVDGATVLGNGQVVLILNPVALSARTPVEPTSPPSFETAPHMMPPAEIAPARLPTVMVVDDSLTVRKITGRLLAREGYQVVLAKDGVEALELLLDVVPDVMLVDIEMPRMDGFDLTRNVRADARLQNVPIIMITSRTAEKHRNYAQEIGVNHYLGKPYQEDELLALIAGYMVSYQPA